MRLSDSNHVNVMAVYAWVHRKVNTKNNQALPQCIVFIFNVQWCATNQRFVQALYFKEQRPLVKVLLSLYLCRLITTPPPPAIHMRSNSLLLLHSLLQHNSSHNNLHPHTTKPHHSLQRALSSRCLMRVLGCPPPLMTKQGSMTQPHYFFP